MKLRSTYIGLFIALLATAVGCKYDIMEEDEKAPNVFTVAVGNIPPHTQVRVVALETVVALKPTDVLLIVGDV